MPFNRTASWLVVALFVLLLRPGRCPADIPDWLPRYDLDMQVDVNGHEVRVHQRVTWVNRHKLPATEIVFNAHSHYQVPGGFDGLFLGKMLEILRMPMVDGMDDPRFPPPLQIKQITLAGTKVPFHY